MHNHVGKNSPEQGVLAVGVIDRLRVVSNFGNGDCGAREIHTHARNFEATQREGSFRLSLRVASPRNFARTRVCILPAPQSPLPKLETTRSLWLSCQKSGKLQARVKWLGMGGGGGHADVCVKFSRFLKTVTFSDFSSFILKIAR